MKITAAELKRLQGRHDGGDLDAVVCGPSRAGTKVVFAFPGSACDADKRRAKRHLKVGNVYTIARVESGDVWTRLYLREAPEETWFNSVNFAYWRKR